MQVALYEPGQQLKESAAYPDMGKAALLPLSMAGMEGFCSSDDSTAASRASSRSSSKESPTSREVLKQLCCAQWEDSGSECSTMDTGVQGSPSRSESELPPTPASGQPLVDAVASALEREEVVSGADVVPERALVSGMACLLESLADRQPRKPPVAAVLRTVTALVPPGDFPPGLEPAAAGMAQACDYPPGLEPPVADAGHPGDCGVQKSYVPPTFSTGDSSRPRMILQLEHVLVQEVKASREPLLQEVEDEDEDEDDNENADCLMGALPSIGSAEHFNGRCKPCAFFRSKGCETGVNCRFCHICDSGERQRRRKARKALVRTLTRERRQRINFMA